MSLLEQFNLWFMSINLKGLTQVLFLILAISWAYNRFIRGGQAEHLLKGVFVVLLMFVGLWGGARLLDLKILETVFLSSLFILLIGLIVIFQPELRRTLLFLGQGELFGMPIFLEHGHDNDERKPEYLIQELCETIHFLSKSKRGALIVLESPKNQHSDYLEAGTTLDAKLSTELLLTIFHPNTPLHDGAVVISPDNRITAAGVLLPLTENPELSWQYGTRHRAAIGLTEISDSRCLVVSEETGHISMAYAGKLERLENAEELRRALERIYHVTLKSQDGKRDRDGARRTGISQLNERIQKIFRPGKKASTSPGNTSSTSSVGSTEKLPKSGTTG